jgi:hypothetical protein
MGTILTIAIVVLLTLAALTYFAGKRAADKREEPPVYALLPGDITYESPSGNFRFYFPITTSIVLSIVLTLALRLFG